MPFCECRSTQTLEIKNERNDFGFADTVGNTFWTIAIVFFIFFLVMKENFRKETLFIPGFVAFLIIYELFQEILPGSNFDWKDVIATIVAGVLSYLIYRFLDREAVKCL